MVSTKLKVKELLRERRWTTKVLAEKTGMSESYLTHIKNGTRRWNEDALRKLASAFGMNPIDLFAFQQKKSESEEVLKVASVVPSQRPDGHKVKVVPVVGEIPDYPSEYNNQLSQVATGYKGAYVPVFGYEDASMFCLSLEDNAMTPRFAKGDLLVISPELWTRSGDVVAVEYGQDGVMQKGIMQVNYMEDFVVLESVNHRKAPIALVRGKDSFRIIGKVILRYQKM